MANDRELYKKEFRDIGLMISYYRKRQNLSQEALAERAGISRAYLSQLEAPNVAVRPALSTLFALAKALEIPPYKLLKAPD